MQMFDKLIIQEQLENGAFNHIVTYDYFHTHAGEVLYLGTDKYYVVQTRLLNLEECTATINVRQLLLPCGTEIFGELPNDKP